MNLYQQGQTYTQIAKAINRSCSTVFDIIKRSKERNTLINSERKGRPRKLTFREERKIVNIVKKAPMVSASEIAAQLHNDLGENVHPKTVKRTLHRAGYSARVPRRKPCITRVNNKKRLLLAN